MTIRIPTICTHFINVTTSKYEKYTQAMASYDEALAIFFNIDTVKTCSGSLHLLSEWMFIIKKDHRRLALTPLPASKKNAENLSDLLLGMGYILFRNRPIIDIFKIKDRGYGQMQGRKDFINFVDDASHDYLR